MGFVIFGAGMAGLLAAAVLRDEAEAVIEAQPSLPNNHSAVLRFRSSVVSDVTGIPFAKVKVMKAIDAWRNPVADMLAYSQKVSGQLHMRSVVTASGEINERYIAPPTFISDLHNKCNTKIHFGVAAKTIDQIKYTAQHCSIIWTGPLFSIARMCGLIDDRQESAMKETRSRGGVNVIMKLNPSCDVYATLYVPDPRSRIARISITGSEMVAECPGWSIDNINEKEIFADACFRMGIQSDQVLSVESKEQRYAKILPINDDFRKSLITRLTREHGIYVLGRYATWRPGLLLDDVVNDIRVIQRLVKSPSSDYQYTKKGY